MLRLTESAAAKAISMLLLSMLACAVTIATLGALKGPNAVPLVAEELSSLKKQFSEALRNWKLTKEEERKLKVQEVDDELSFVVGK